MKPTKTALIRTALVILDYARLRWALLRSARHPGESVIACSTRQGRYYTLTTRMGMVNVRQTDTDHGLRRSHFIPSDRVARYLWRSVQ